MAYGAILRLCAARGLPERAIGLLEDMERFEVKPTTLCFTAALKSVARSHEIANRYQRGTSRRDMKRETITAHHGKMARQIVILAEAAEVEQDDGFTSALMLCAAAAGDSATAKAILLATEVRKLDHLRTIGGARPDALEDRDNDLQLVSRPISIENQSEINAKDGRNLPDKIIAEGALSKQPQNYEQNISFGEREYGRDTRVISALVHSCAQALNKNGLGTMWAGRENLGYLCENSLRLITTRWEPSYRDTSVPGIDSSKVGIGALRHMDEREKDYEYTPGKRKKFRGLFVDEDELATIDDIETYSDDEESENSLTDEQYAELEDFEKSLAELEDKTQGWEFDEHNSGSSNGNDLILQHHKISPTDEENNSLSKESNLTPNGALAELDPAQLLKIQDLQSVLPGLPLPRVKKILNAYDQTLGHPSMLTLVPIVRETMPDYVSHGWLKRSNKQNADFALQKASEDGIVDSPLLNSMLGVKANSGSLNEAIQYHDEQFAKHKLVSIQRSRKFSRGSSFEY